MGNGRSELARATEQELNLSETEEREQLGEPCIEIAHAAGLDPTKQGGGEEPASEWRDG